MINDSNELKPLVSLKAKNDDLDVEVSLTPEFKESNEVSNPELRSKLEEIEKKISLKRKEIDYYDDRIFNLTNQGDSLDHSLAAGCGILAAIMDILLVDGVSFKGGLNIAKGSQVEGLANTLLASKNGVVSGVFPGGSNLAENLIFGTINWFFNIIGTGASGLPLPIKGLVNSISSSKPASKLLSANNMEAVGAYIKTKTANNSLSFASGIDTLILLGKQTLPVLVNECLVRAFYFIRRFFKEISDKDISSPSELYRVDWDNTVPFKNRTIVRMMTISTLVFSAVDIAAATVEGVLVSDGNLAKFFSKFIISVNFIGVGRAIVACGTDLLMGVMQRRDRQDRALLIDEMIRLENIKMSYKQKDVWVKAKKAEDVINESYSMMARVQEEFNRSYYGNKEDLASIGSNVSKIEDKNPGLVDEINDILHME